MAQEIGNGPERRVAPTTRQCWRGRLALCRRSVQSQTKQTIALHTRCVARSRTFIHVTGSHTLCIWLQSDDGARLDGELPRDDKDVQRRVWGNDKTTPSINSESHAIRSRSERTTPTAPHFRKPVLASSSASTTQACTCTCPRALRKLSKVSLILGTSLDACGARIVRVPEFVCFLFFFFFFFFFLGGGGGEMWGEKKKPPKTPPGGGGWTE